MMSWILEQVIIPIKDKDRALLINSSSSNNLIMELVVDMSISHH